MWNWKTYKDKKQFVQSSDTQVTKYKSFLYLFILTNFHMHLIKNNNAKINWPWKSINDFAQVFSNNDNELSLWRSIVHAIYIIPVKKLPKSIYQILYAAEIKCGVCCKINLHQYYIKEISVEHQDKWNTPYWLSY